MTGRLSDDDLEVIRKEVLLDDALRGPGGRVVNARSLLGHIAVLQAELVAAEEANQQLRAALEEIVALPSDHDLLFNAEARALHTIARAALAASRPSSEATWRCLQREQTGDLPASEEKA